MSKPFSAITPVLSALLSATPKGSSAMERHSFSAPMPTKPDVNIVKVVVNLNFK